MGERPRQMEVVVIDPNFWNGRRVFLTGHTGFKGAWMSLLLNSLVSIQDQLGLRRKKRDGGSIDLHRCTADNPLKGSMAMWIRFLRFVVVGLANTVFGYAVFAALYMVLNSYRPAIVIATVTGVLFNFISMGSAVFANRSIRPFLPYILSYAIVCGINIFLIDWLVALGSKPLLAQMTVLPFLAVISFVINDRIVFGRLA